MTTQQRQITLLGVLLIVWAGILWWAISKSEDPQRVPLVNVTGAAGATNLTSDPSSATLRVHLAELKQSRAERAAGAPTSKNIFELRRSDQTLTELLPPLPEEFPTEIPEPSLSDMQAESAWAELGQFRYLGYVELGDHGRNREEVALLAKQDVLHTVRRGEIIGAAILVAAITPNMVVLRHTPSQIEQQLSLTNEAP